MAVGVTGLGVAAYLAAEHYNAGVPLICPRSGLINCERVLTRPEALWAGIPVAVWGIAWFIVAIGLAVRSLACGDAPEPAWLRSTALVWVTAGAAAVVWLIYTELAVIGAVCVWCTAAHALIVALFVIQVLTDPQRASPRA